VRTRLLVVGPASCTGATNVPRSDTGGCGAEVPSHSSPYITNEAPKGSKGVHSTMPLVVLIVVIAAIALVAIGLWVVNSVD
jgi:hypothetical protein